MSSFDGSNKSLVGGGQNIPYWECSTTFIENIKQKAMASASPEAIAEIDPLNYKGPKVIADASLMTADEWQEARKNSIGSSAVAQIFGDSPYPGCTNLDLYYDKVGQPILIEDDDVEKERKERMFLYGHLMEEYLHLITQQYFPRAQQLIVDTNIYAAPNREFLTANLDRMMQLSDGSWVHVEFKTSSMFNEKEWENNTIPTHYKRQLIQCQHIMGVWVSYIIVAFSRDKFLVRKYERDLDAEYDQIIEAEDFWNNNVLAHIPPNPLGDATNLVSSIRRHTGYGDKTIPAIILSPIAAQAVKEYKEISDEISALDARKKKLQEARECVMVPIVSEMGNCCSAVAELDDKTSFRVDYTPRAGSRTVDYEGLQANYPDIYEAYVTKKKEGSRTMRIVTRS